MHNQSAAGSGTAPTSPDVYSPRVVAGVLNGRVLVGVSKVEAPRAARTGRGLRSGPVAAGLDVREQIIVAVMDRGN